MLGDELVEQLSALWPRLRVVARATDGVAALHAVEEHEPSIAFVEEGPGLAAQHRLTDSGQALLDNGRRWVPGCRAIETRSRADDLTWPR